MSAVRERKERAKRVALALHQRYRELATATGEDAVQIAAIALGDTFNSNIEFIINVMRDYAGLEAKFEPMTRTVRPPIQTPAILSGQDR